MKHGTLLYDTYRAAAHDRTQVARAMADTEFAALHQAMGGGMDMSDVWDAARVYVLTVEALEVVTDAAMRLQPGQIAIPRPLALPTWIEFDEQRVLRIEGMPWQFSGILLYAESDRVMAELLGAGTMAGIAYRPNSGVWDSPLIEASRLAPEAVRCQHTTCPIRARASRVAHIGSVSSGDVLLAESGMACSCWGLRQDLLLLITAFLSFLIADGVVSEEITVLPAPQSHSQRRHHSGAGIPRNPIRYQRLSLTHPQPFTVRRLANGQAEVTPQGVMEGTLSREITRRPHPRLLIAGPGQRWTKTQIVFVHASKPFHRRVSGNPTRFIVEA